MPFAELNLDMQEARTRNAKTGRFMKGHVPENKGKTWNEYMGKRAQKRASKGWSNLDKFRPKKRPDNAGRCSKPVIAIMQDGTWLFIPDLGKAGEWVNGRRENVRRCCKQNKDRHVNKKTGDVNTDHAYNGVRFYYENDDIWMTKINNKDR